ncbi:MAG: hypothetical protein Q9222_005201 [Ikaeria aurantiellina]
MPAPEPDLERGDGALKVPANPFAPPPASPNAPPTKTANPSRHHNRKPSAGAKPRSQSRTRRQSQQRPISHHFVHDPTAVPPKLQKLRTVIGISTPESLAPSTKSTNPFSRRPAPNLGIYARIAIEERNARLQFYATASLINACYFGQIIVAAALTALGASSSSHIVITVLGALNTVIAGILTYLKGQGLPNRLRQYWNGLRKCREFIEEKERQCEAEGWGEDGDEGMDIEHEIEVMVRMYHDVRQTAEDNTPDTYLPMQGASASLLTREKGGAATGAHAPVGMNHPNGSSAGSIRYPEDDMYSDDDDDKSEPGEGENLMGGHAEQEEGGKKVENGNAVTPAQPLAPTPNPTPTPGRTTTTTTPPVDGAAKPQGN